jgi:gamma-glutamyltranspeptidase / glutathione hydrolase
MPGVVVAPQPRAVEVGAEILAQGGNAMDATVAAAFMQMVVDPFMCGVGGMGTMVVYRAGADSPVQIDFHARAGERVAPEMWQDDVVGITAVSRYAYFADYRNELGYQAIMTPGTVAGFFEAHRRFGTRAWADLLAPAIRTARQGWAVTPFVHEFWSRPPTVGKPDGLRRISTTPDCARLYLRADGSLKRVGDLVVNPDMAHTLEQIAHGGPEAFYRGDLGTCIVEDLAHHNAFVTAKDLRSYEVKVTAPLIGSYRGYRVATNPPPGSGLTILEMLNILEGFELRALGHNSVSYIDLVARTMAAAHADRNAYLGDPDFVDVPIARLMSKEHAKEWQERIRSGYGKVGTRPDAPPSETTHLAVYDRHGNAISMTHTLATGSGVITPGLGFVYNNAMELFDPIPGRANSIAPGKGRITGMCPTILFRHGQPYLLVGAPGGSVIISAVLQTILNVIDFGMSPIEAVSEPRMHCEGGAVHLEARFSTSVAEQLRALGHQVDHRVLSYDPTMARAMAIMIDGDSVRGGSDPRGGGGVAYA